MENDQIILELDAFVARVDRYQESLNTEGVWLFLATLGCWSVSNKLAQLIALSITFFLFSYRIYKKSELKTTFGSATSQLRRLISSAELPEDARKARLYDLDQIVKGRLSLRSHARRTFVFLVCYLFLAVTFLAYFDLLPAAS
jgi:hypothetical protein